MSINGLHQKDWFEVPSCIVEMARETIVVGGHIQRLAVRNEGKAVTSWWHIHAIEQC